MSQKSPKTEKKTKAKKPAKASKGKSKASSKSGVKITELPKKKEGSKTPKLRDIEPDKVSAPAPAKAKKKRKPRKKPKKKAPEEPILAEEPSVEDFPEPPSDISEPEQEAVAKPPVKGAKLVFGYLGVFIMFMAAMLIIPLFMLIPFHGENQIHDALYCFLTTAAGALVVGFLLFLFIFRKETGHLTTLEATGLVIMVWIAAIWISAIPWTIKWATTEPYCTEYNLWQIITQSVFEMTSGYTTTGLSVVDVDATLEAGGELFLFFRAFTQFIGGVGLLLVLTSAISDVRGISAYTLEGHNDKLLPNIVRSARLIFAIYLFYLAIGVAAYCGVGMPWFDALTTAMAAIATGGFHIRSVSISYYSSLPYGQVPVEIITEVLMLLGSTNFLVHYYFLRGRWNKAFRHFEFGVLLMAFVLIYPWMAVGMAYHYMASPYNLDWASSWGMGCRVGFFEFMNAITGTGFTLVGTATNPFGASDSYMSLPGYVYMCLIVVMVIGGETGSTSGGIKQSRVAYTWLAVKESFYRMTHRQNVYHTRYFYRYGQKEVYDVREAASTIVFIIVYFLVAISATVLLSLDVNLEGYTNAGEQWTFGECFFEITSALATVGISAGVTSASAPTFSLWVMTLCMFLGRLEILIVFNFFRQVFRDAHHSIEKRVSRRKMAVK